MIAMTLEATRATWRRAALALGIVAAVACAPGLGAQQADGPVSPGQAVLEQRVRQRLAAIVREQLSLDDSQARRLGDVSTRYERERRALALRERELRLQLRDELQGGEQADQDRVARALDRMLEVQRTRLDIVQREQKDLGAFLTPVQRAKYLVLQEQVRRRLEEARRAQEAAPGAGGRPRALRPRPRLP